MVLRALGHAVGVSVVLGAPASMLAMEPVNPPANSAVKGLVVAQKKPPKPEFTVPVSGFFAGVGVSRSYFNFTNLDSYSQGVSKGYSLVYQSEYTGAASGSTNTGLLNGVSNSSPAAQLGYYQRFSKASPWVWGLKATYAFLNAEAQSDKTLLVPQSGGYTPPIGAGNGHLTGNVVIKSVTAKVNNQIGLLPILGRAYKRGFVYLGGGPAWSQTIISNNGVDGTAVNVATGRIDSQTDREKYNFTGSSWSVGWQVSAGATYFIDSRTFLDLSYSYAQTGYTSIPYSANFRGIDYGDATLNEGTLSGNTNGAIANQSVILTINRRF
jgi:opacity protein-like surface antigen